MASKIGRSLLSFLRSSSSGHQFPSASSMAGPTPLPGFSRASISSLSGSLGAINLNRPATAYSPIKSGSNLISPVFPGRRLFVRFHNSSIIQRMRFPKHRKGRIEGVRDGGNEICFGKYGLMALEPARITSRQIEAGRRALQLNARRGGKGGKVWVRICAFKSVTSKPAETRMGRGKGAIAYWVAPVKPGQILYEMGGVTEALAKRAIEIAGSKMPIRTKSIIRDPRVKEIGIK